MNRVIKIILISIMFMANNVSAGSIRLINAELEGFDRKSKQILINGKRYDFDLDINKSNYSEENLNQKQVKTQNLRPGLKYYFSIYSSGEKSKSTDTVVFVSTEEPES